MMVIEAVFELPLLFASPAYDAVSVSFPAVVPDTVREHCDSVDFTVERMHVAGLRETAPAPDWEKVTFPVGV